MSTQESKGPHLLAAVLCDFKKAEGEDEVTLRFNPDEPPTMFLPADTPEMEREDKHFAVEIPLFLQVGASGVTGAFSILLGVLAAEDFAMDNMEEIGKADVNFVHPYDTRGAIVMGKFHGAPGWYEVVVVIARDLGASMEPRPERWLRPRVLTRVPFRIERLPTAPPPTQDHGPS